MSNYVYSDLPSSPFEVNLSRILDDQPPCDRRDLQLETQDHDMLLRFVSQLYGRHYPGHPKGVTRSVTEFNLS